MLVCLYGWKNVCFEWFVQEVSELRWELNCKVEIVEGKKGREKKRKKEKAWVLL